VNVHIDRKNYRVRTAVTGRKRARVPAGTFDCLVVAPSAQGPLGTVLIAEDSSRTPVVIKTRVGGLVVSAFLLSTDTEE
ncbi:DUF3108 domain-containing protein, partial [candidate division WOR-3 bacterium]|nr:DUF3108 domain-containing protein [candidate division WOR-3 bacterium]